MSLWKKAHEMNGNECDFITLYHNPNQSDAGICLNLPLISTDAWYLKYRHQYYKYYRGELGDYQEKKGPLQLGSQIHYLKNYFLLQEIGFGITILIQL